MDRQLDFRWPRYRRLKSDGQQTDQITFTWLFKLQATAVQSGLGRTDPTQLLLQSNPNSGLARATRGARVVSVKVLAGDLASVGLGTWARLES